LLAGCGSGASDRSAAPPPTLPGALAADLATGGDAVAAALQAGRDCRARTLAEGLQRRTIAAINAKRVPGPLQEPLQSGVNHLAAGISCPSGSTPGAPAAARRFSAWVRRHSQSSGKAG
jgi:hypothetical protein